jgi:hypothetical protein
MRIAPPDDNVRIPKMNQPASNTGAETRPVAELIESARMPRLEERHEHDAHVREAERRQYQRRKRNAQTTLDTRDPHERRTRDRRKENAEQLSAESDRGQTRGIDERA